MDWLTDIDAGWAWIALGLTLAALEMIAPGVYLIWLALAALATGARRGQGRPLSAATVAGWG